MTNLLKSISLSLFGYIDDYADAIREGSHQDSDEFDPAWEIFGFCENFFNQFFALFDVHIKGFTQRSREAATELIERMRSSNEGTAEARAIIVLYEEFCDMAANTKGGYGEPSTMDVLSFHEEYLSELLSAALTWAQSASNDALAERILSANRNYMSAVEATR